MIDFLFGLIIGSIVTYIVEHILFSVPFLKKNFWDNPRTIFGYHIHHTVFGLIVIVLGVFLFASNISYALFLIGIGIGIIGVHTYFDKRLIFIEKIGS